MKVQYALNVLRGQYGQALFVHNIAHQVPAQSMEFVNAPTATSSKIAVCLNALQVSLALTIPAELARPHAILAALLQTNVKHAKLDMCLIPFPIPATKMLLVPSADTDQCLEIAVLSVLWALTSLIQPAMIKVALWDTVLMRVIELVSEQVLLLAALSPISYKEFVVFFSAIQASSQIWPTESVRVALQIAILALT